jgi:hypothetical protein
MNLIIKFHIPFPSQSSQSPLLALPVQKGSKVFGEVTTGPKILCLFCNLYEVSSDQNVFTEDSLSIKISKDLEICNNMEDFSLKQDSLHYSSNGQKIKDQV